MLLFAQSLRSLFGVDMENIQKLLEKERGINAVLAIQLKEISLELDGLRAQIAMSQTIKGRIYEGAILKKYFAK